MNVPRWLLPGAGGPPTSTVDWCEENYIHSPYIAEFHNTWSNFLFVAIGTHGVYFSYVHGYELRFTGVYVGVAVIGLGSMGANAVSVWLIMWVTFWLRFGSDLGARFGMSFGVASGAAFHATLLKVAQQCDETPMIWSVLCWLYVLRPLFSPSLGRL
jgi:dihydroceramidase